MLTISLVAFLVFLFIGVPISFTMGLGPIIGMMSAGMSNIGTLVPQRIFVGNDSFEMLAIPLFMLAGVFMEAGGISRRLVQFCNSLVGHITGGLGISGVLACLVFSGVSGSSAADTAAVGSVMIPAMKKNGYKPGLAATLIACAGSLGSITPPSLVMILYATLTGISITGLFLAGVIPGLLIALGLMLVMYYYGRKYGLKEDRKFDWRELLKSAKEAFWALLMPLFIIGGLVGGIFTPTEAGVIAVVYAFIIGFFVYKEFTWKDLPKIFVQAAGSSSMIMLLVSGAAVLGWIVAYGKLPMYFMEMITGLSNDPTIVMLLVIAFIMIVGIFIETIPATIICAPLLIPIMQKFGYDPIQFGFVVVASFIFAAITPPVGGLLNITMGISRCKMAEMMPYITPFLGIMMLVVLLCVFFPQIATFLPSLYAN